MNVLVVSDCGFSVGVGGTELYSNILSDILEHMNESKVVRVSLRVADKRADLSYKGRKGIMMMFFNADLLKALQKIIEKNNVDLIHANIVSGQVAYMFSNIYDHLNLKVPLVITAHLWFYLCPTKWNVQLPSLKPCNSHVSTRCLSCTFSNEKLRKPSVTGVIRGVVNALLGSTIFFRKLLRNASCIISPSKEFASVLSHEVRAKVHYIPHPVPRELLEMKPEPSGDGSVIFIGRLVDEKGVRLLPSIAKFLSGREIHVVGYGPLEDWLLRHKTRNIIYHGPIHNEIIKFNLLKKASVLIAPSIIFDIWNYTVTEAFIAGKPVVAFELGGPKEQIEASGGGLLAPLLDIKAFAEKVSTIVENASVAENMGLRGRRYVEDNCSPDKYAKALLRVYQDAIEGSETIS